jgi:hypothetical protein
MVSIIEPWLFRCIELLSSLSQVSIFIVYNCFLLIVAKHLSFCRRVSLELLRVSLLFMVHQRLVLFSVHQVTSISIYIRIIVQESLFLKFSWKEFFKSFLGILRIGKVMREVLWNWRGGSWSLKLLRVLAVEPAYIWIGWSVRRWSSLIETVIKNLLVLMWLLKLLFLDVPNIEELVLIIKLFYIFSKLSIKC